MRETYRVRRRSLSGAFCYTERPSPQGCRRIGQLISVATCGRDEDDQGGTSRGDTPLSTSLLCRLQRYHRPSVSVELDDSLLEYVHTIVFCKSNAVDRLLQRGDRNGIKVSGYCMPRYRPTHRLHYIMIWFHAQYNKINAAIT